MNLGQFRTSLRPKIGNPSTTDVPDTPNLDGHINDAYQEILNKFKFKQRRARAKFTTTIGADKYKVSTLTDAIFKAWDRTNGKELEKVGTNILSEQDFDNSASLSVPNGRPQKWTYIETYFQLLPPPDGAYSIEFVYKVIYVALANVNDTPIIPVTWHRGMTTLAASMYYEDEAGDPVKAKYFRDLFKDWVSDQPVEEHEETEGIDSGVEIPTLAQSLLTQRRPDGVFWDIIP